MIYENAQLLIPEGTLDAYKAASSWKNFFNIKEADLSDVVPVAADVSMFSAILSDRILNIESATDVDIFTSDGTIYKQIPAGESSVELPSGMFILSSRSHKQKILIK